PVGGKLLRDLRMIAEQGEMPDGDGVPVNVRLWAEKHVAALTPAATYATPDDVALNMGPDDIPRLLIAGAQVARFPKGSWTEVCEAFDFGGYRNEQPAATPRGEEAEERVAKAIADVIGHGMAEKC